MKVSRAREAKYPIRAVSKLTGLSIDTLRAWERRYKAVTPTRDDRGRLYSEADVARLRLLNQAVLSGHSIGRAASLNDDELRRLQSLASATPSKPVAPAHADFRAALARFDSGAVDRELARLAAVMAPADLVRDLLLPELRAVGDEWNRGQGGVAREHLMSAAIRHLLGSFLRLHTRPEGVRLLFATPSGDRHEIGTLGAAMLAASRGFSVTYLGPDLPAAQILEAVRAAENVSVLVLGVTLPSRFLARELRTVVRDLPRGIELWAGGAAVAHHHRLISTRGLVLASFDAYLEQLTRLAGIAA
jgi:DNA-binding transcriptional MerR regulator